MLNSTKTWQEEFDEMSEIEEFWGLPYDHLVDKAVKQFISDIITKTREETIRDVEQLIPERKDGGKNFDQWQYYCQGYNDLRDYILNKLKK